jgi:hypothetical protein
MTRSLGRTLLALLLAAAPAAAQLPSYYIPGSLGEPRIQVKDAVMQSYQNARWQVGFLHLDPRLAITDLGYISNVYSTLEEEAESDFKAQGAAGLRGFFNLGPKILVSPFADLGYTWWQNQEELRSFDESFGLQLFGDFNRLQFQVHGGRVETQRNLSSELEIPVDVRTDRFEIDLEIDFWGPFRFFATAADDGARHFGEAAEARLPTLDLSLLDVDTELLIAGFGYELGNGVSIGLGYQRTDSIYLEDPDGRSNRGSGPLLRIALDGTRLTMDIDIAPRDLEFDARAGAGDRSQLSGLGRMSWRFTEKLSAGLYSAAQLEASALDSAAIFEKRRSGISLQRQAGERTRVRAFYETGEDEFATVSSDQVTRVDDFTSYGIGFAVELGERLTVEVGFYDTQRDSTDPEFDRDLRSVTSRVRLGGNLLPW